jgi:hypothetical protein
VKELISSLYKGGNVFNKLLSLNSKEREVYKYLIDKYLSEEKVSFKIYIPENDKRILKNAASRLKNEAPEVQTQGGNKRGRSLRFCDSAILD